MKIQVIIRLKPGVLDVQGKAVEKGLLGMGFDGVQSVRVGKVIELDIAEEDYDKAKSEVSKMCEALLANTVIEEYEILQRE